MAIDAAAALRRAQRRCSEPCGECPNSTRDLTAGSCRLPSDSRDVGSPHPKNNRGSRSLPLLTRRLSHNPERRDRSPSQWRNRKLSRDSKRRPSRSKSARRVVGFGLSPPQQVARREGLCGSSSGWIADVSDYPGETAQQVFSGDDAGHGRRDRRIERLVYTPDRAAAAVHLGLRGESRGPCRSSHRSKARR